MASTSDVQGNASVVSLVVTMTFKPEHEQDFLAVARNAIKSVREQEPGNLLYVLTKHPTEPHTYVWIERYADGTALEQHGKMPYIQDALTKLPGWFAKPPAMLRLAQVSPE
jgi:quinol monooxygenase YgiN